MSKLSVDEARPPSSPADPQSLIFAGGGEMGALMRALDWSQTPLGPVEDWPQSLKTTVSICLSSRFPIVLYWGPEYVVLYNDAYSQILGAKHPWALGQTCRVCWAEIWDTIGPMLDGVLATGEATWSNDLLLRLRRFSYPEECYFSFSFSPVRVESGAMGGVFTAVIETTEKVIGERRLRTLRDLAARASAAQTEQATWKSASTTIAENPHDIPFAVLCEAAGDSLRIAATAGIDPRHPLCAALCDSRSELSRSAMQVMTSAQAVALHDLTSLQMDLPRGPWDAPPRSAMLLPLAALGHGASGLLLAAASPAKAVDEAYGTFFDLLARQIATSIADIRAYEDQRKRAEELAELDRAKTTFFSNVSHEFRTPLTLMLGPLEGVLSRADAAIGSREREDLVVVRRNALRLLKLVNTLLEFTRIEAGRVKATYDPVDLAALTAEIAGIFRSAMEQAGLRFTVQCEPLSEPVYVDCEMWEKIVLNLLSNAFKFTFAGEVAVRQRRVKDRIELEVRDTGTGIPASEMPRIFERFHRIEAPQARTHEGSGIGLALVQELVRLHGGEVRAESAEGKGSIFTVSIPLGKAHLAPDQIGQRGASRVALEHSGIFLEEAQRWLPEPAACFQSIQQAPAEPSGIAPNSKLQREKILVADDNADMREYLRHLLSAAYDVHVVGDGNAAVEAAKRLRPSLVLTDVMMPGLDGFGVLRAIREQTDLSSTPVILLSARAGEESRVEGLDAGADDYLVKPFTARELRARVGANIRMARVRREAADLEKRLRAQAESERQRLHEVLAQAPAAIGLLHGPEHRWVYVNDAYLRLTGVRRAEDLIGKSIRETRSELQGQPFLEMLDQVFRTGQTRSGREFKARLRKDGVLRDVYFDFVYQPVRNPDKQVVGILVHSIDVTDRVVARKAVDDSHERLRAAHMVSQRLAAIVQSSDDAIVSKDLKGIVTSWNPGAQRIFGYTPEEMIGQSITRIIPPELLDDEKRILATIARGERIQHFETVRMTKSGERIDVSLTISPVQDVTGKIVGASKIARDITQRKKAERALHTSERLATVGRLAATIAHEINNPLAALTNLVYLAKANNESPVVRPYLEQAEEELSRVSLLTRQTLGFYRETKGTRPISLGSVITPLVAAMQPRARNKAIGIWTNFRQDPEIRAIPGEIRQLIANLITNSLDAAAGASTIQVRVAAASFIHGKQKSGVRLTIADQGEGIPPEARSHLFEPFFTTKKEVGTGLGLWVCHNIVQKHGGSIRYKSSTRLGKSGTVFCVFLPCEPAPGLNEAATHPAPRHASAAD